MSQADSIEEASHDSSSIGQPDEWLPLRNLRCIDEGDIELSRGFLRSRPEKWFPGFAADWLPLAHSLGIETRLIEVKPQRRAPRGLEVGYYGTIDGERIGIFFDGESAKNILSGVCPGSGKEASSIVLEYLIRRFFSSMMTSWSGADSSVVQFTARAETMEFSEAGAIKFSVIINGSTTIIWILLGHEMVNRLDGLWRRQIKSSNRTNDEESELRIELAATNLSPASAYELTRAGQVINFESQASDMVTLTLSGKAWLPARLCIAGNNIGLEMVASSFPQYPHADGSARVTLEYPIIFLDSGLVSELSQIGALYQTPLVVNSPISVHVDGKKVSEAKLYIKNNRFLAKIR